MEEDGSTIHSATHYLDLIMFDSLTEKNGLNSFSSWKKKKTKKHFVLTSGNLVSIFLKSKTGAPLVG